MKNNSQYSKFLFLGLLVLAIVYFLPSAIPQKVLSGFSDFPSWYVYSLSEKSLKPFKIVAVAIDDNSLNKIPQRWPWERSLYAQVLKKLDKEGVRTVGIDFVFVGESEDRDDDLQLKDTLRSISSRVVLAYLFDPKKRAPILPPPELREASYATGMVNTPQDQDGLVRRLRARIEYEGETYYSFSVAISAAFLNQKPRGIISSCPLLKDQTYLIKYLLKPRDIIRVSFSDVLENTEKLKQQYGQDFLKDALVLIYPEAEIFHDIQFTPLGKMPGGILHLNGVADILSRRFLNKVDILAIPFLIFTLGVICYILRHSGFISGILLVLGVFFIDFWSTVFLNLAGITFDYSRILISGILLFILGILYEYVDFLTQLLDIKYKATLDPLRGVFSLRYFYYRLELELKKIRFRKDPILIFIYLESFKDAMEDAALERARSIWRQIQSVISLKASFWSAYSQEELVGCLISPLGKLASSVQSLKNNLEAILKEEGIVSKIKIGYLRLKKEYPARELLFILSGQMKNAAQDVVLFKESELLNQLKSSYLKTEKSAELLGSLGEDIEDKNRQLLSLIENLNREHAKTKEAFFEIITSLVKALEARDPYTEGHSQRVCNYALRMAQRLGWGREEQEKLRKAALLHDLGKIGIPDSILHKKGSLNEEELDFIKKHEIIAVKILEPLKEISEILPWILYHHERWDGKGYPHGLAGNAIPLASQIISLCDVFDALMTGRDYKAAFSFEEAQKGIIQNKGTQFNPQLVDLFIEVIKEMREQK